MTDYLNVLKEILEGIKNKEFAVFCGAGISLNSELPLANTLKRYILEKLTKNKDDIEEIMDSKLPFEAFIEVLAENSNISKILEMFKNGEPNTNHILIAKLAKTGLIKTIGTTNFDMLIERALEKEGLKRSKDFEVYYNEMQFSEIDFDALNKSDKICVFKLHGSIEDERSIRTTMKAVASKLLSEKRENVIKYIFSNKSHKNVLILGYSCSDIFDITPQIQSIENSKSKIFLLSEQTEAPKVEPQIEDIKNLKLNGRSENPFNEFNGYIIKHKTDNFVNKIWDSLIKEPKLETKPKTKTKKTEWQNFVDEWSNNLREDIKHFICGKIFKDISDFKRAIEYYEISLKIDKEIGDKAGESKCYTNLGVVYIDLGEFKKAIECHEKSLKIDKEIGDKAGESKCYTNLGVAYRNLGDFKKAIECHEKALEINKEIEDKPDESACYSNLGLAYHNLGDFKKAIECHEKALEINKEIEDKSNESKYYLNLGAAYYSLGDFKKSIEYFEKSLKIRKEIGDKAGESKCYTDLGVVYIDLDDFKKAIEYFEKAIPIFIETSQSYYLKIVYKNLSIAYEKMKNFEKSEEYRRKSEEI